ncbi:MAG: hypothetical protein KAH95_07495, partial [Spirochaetales bacterium]|nr:hypothetical protein [Spirochaetales bacterium]
EDKPSSDITGPIFVTGSSDAISCAATMEQESFFLYSPWGESAGVQGSYVYNNTWETIDHVLLNSAFFDNEGFEYKSFRVVSDNYLLNPWEEPSAWRTETGYGYSDHLPLILEITCK